MAWRCWRYICAHLANICLISWAIHETYAISDDQFKDNLNARVPASPSGRMPASRSPGYDEDFDSVGIHGLPGAQHELVFEVGGGKKQCLFQYLRSGAQLHVSFQVIRGADYNVNLEVHSPAGELVELVEWTNHGNVDKVVSDEGIYAFCIDNSMSTFTSKLVSFYLLSYSNADWQAVAQELQEFNVGVENYTKVLEMIQQNANQVLMVQAVIRRQAITDWYMLSRNNSFVGTASIVLCIVILLTSIFQVYFVRRLFNVHGTGVRSSSKPRA